MQDRTYARGEYEEAKDKLSTLRYEYRALSQSAVEAINICEVGEHTLQNNDLGKPDDAIPVVTKLQALKPEIEKLQKQVSSLRKTWNF